jgi:hypothetical protein
MKFQIDDSVIVLDKGSALQGKIGTITRIVIRDSVQFVGDPKPRPVVPPETIYYIRFDWTEGYTIGLRDHQLGSAVLDELARVIE